MRSDSEKEARIKKMIALLVRMGRSALKPDLKNTDYSGWKQTEEEYRQSQQDWLERIAKKKNQNGEKIDK